MTEVSNQSLNVIYIIFFIFIMVSGLHLEDLNNFIRILYIIMYGSAHYVVSQLISQL